MKQVNCEELLDVGRAPLSEVRRSLRDLRRINALPGGTSLSVAGVVSLVGDLQRATIVDVGTGSGDVPQGLRRYAQRRGLDWNIVAVDLKSEHLKLAREFLGKDATPLQADAFRLPFADGSVDVVTTSLLLHHFRAPQVTALLREFDRISRVGWFCNDLVRARPPLVFFTLLWPIFARSYLTRYDARASIRRAYTVPEMRALVQQSGTNAQVRARPMFRLSIEKHR